MKPLSSLQKRVACLALAGLAVAAALFDMQRSTEQRWLQNQARRDLDAAQAGFEAMEMEELRLLDANLDRLAQDPALRSAYLARDRARLQGLARPQFLDLRERYNVTHFNFIDPPPQSTSFLRVDDPTRFGDRVERRTYRQAVESGSFGEGKELGPTAFALRSVRAWRDADGRRVIGYLELGKEIGAFLAELKIRHGNDFALLLDKRYLDPIQWLGVCHAQGRVSDWSDRPIYVLASDTGVLAKQLQWNGILADLPADGKVLGLEQVDGRVFMTGVFPVQDALGRPCGAVLVAGDVTPQLQSGHRTRLALDAAGLLVLALLGFLAGWLLARVDPHGREVGGARAAFGGLGAALGRLWKR